LLGGILSKIDNKPHAINSCIIAKQLDHNIIGVYHHICICAYEKRVTPYVAIWHFVDWQTSRAMSLDSIIKAMTKEAKLPLTLHIAIPTCSPFRKNI